MGLLRSQQRKRRLDRLNHSFDTSEDSFMKMPVPTADWPSKPLRRELWDLPSLNSSPLPAHWDVFDFDWVPNYLAPIRALLRLSTRALCLMAFGHTRLSAVWEVCGSDKLWRETSERLIDRLNTTVVMASLLLGVSAAFLTTTPPLPNFNYNKRGAYLCLMLSFSLSMSSLLVGSTTVVVLSNCHRKWFAKTYMGTTSRVLCTMYLCAFPFLTTALSAELASYGLLIAAWTSYDKWISYGGILVFFFPTSCLPLWWWTQRAMPKETELASGTLDPLLSSNDEGRPTLDSRLSDDTAKDQSTDTLDRSSFLPN